MDDEYPTSIRLTKQLKSDLVKLTRAQGCSLKWLVAHILEEWVKRKKEENARPGN